jgi:DNA-binding transcriptional LysR family regulator
VTFNVRMSSTDEAIETLASGAGEIVLILNPPGRDTIASEQVFRDSIYRCMRAISSIGERKTISLREFAAFPFVLAEPSFGLRQQIDRIFARHHIEPEVFCVTNSLALVKLSPALAVNVPCFGCCRRTTCGRPWCVLSRTSGSLQRCENEPVHYQECLFREQKK